MTIPDEILTLIAVGEERERVQNAQAEEKKRINEEENRELWVAWYKHVKETLPKAVRHYVIENIILERAPLGEVTLIRVPGLADINMRYIDNKCIDRQYSVSRLETSYDEFDDVYALNYSFKHAYNFTNEIENALLAAKLEGDRFDEMRQMVERDNAKLREDRNDDDEVYSSKKMTTEENFIEMLRNLIRSEIRSSNMVSDD